MEILKKLNLIKTKIIINTETQYKTENKIMIFIFNKIEISIQPKLKTEEKAIISIVFFLLNWEIAPKMKQVTINGKTMNLTWYKIKYKGAIFCHVINNKLFFHLIFLTIKMNHCWNGADAILISNEIRDKIAINKKNIFVTLPILKIVNNSREEEIDWITKYLTLISILFFLKKDKSFIREQKDRVLISSIIQIIIHELKIIHMMEEPRIAVRNNEKEIILSNIKLQIWSKNKNYLLNFLNN